jgi:sugar phosphate isomerase/epimerase
MRLTIATLLFLVPAAMHAGEPNPLGVQLWSLKEPLTANVSKGLDLVKSMGFNVVESASVSGIPGSFGISSKEFRAQADARGIRIVSGHFPYERLLGDVSSVIQEAQTLGMSYIVVPWIPHEGDFTVEEAHETAANFNKIGAAIKAAGLSFGFHTHGYEFKRQPDGTTDYDILLRETDPKLVFVEMDVFWVVSGGQDPVELLKKYPGRYRMFHVKDMRKGAVVGGTSGHAPIEDNVIVGQGQMDWPAIFAAGRKAGVIYSFVEDETTDPIGNIPVSLKYLSQLGIRQ